MQYVRLLDPLRALRPEFDVNVVRSVGSKLTMDNILRAYEVMVWDMIVTRGLRKD